MAAQNEVQFYSATLDYNIGEFISNVNFNFHKIINSYPVNLPHMNTGYESVFGQNRREHGNKKGFGLRKREGFTKCFELEGWHVTDIYNHQGVKYAMLVSDDGLKKRIFKQCYATVRYGCYTDTSDTCCSGEWKEITKYKDLCRPFPNYPCVYDKFVPIKGPIGKSKHSSCRGVIANVLEGNTVRSVLYELDDYGNKIQINVDVGDWIYVYDKNGSTAVVGQSLQTSGYNVTNQWLEFGEKFRAGITNQITDFNEEAGITEYKQQFVCFKIFKEYGNAFAFATSDGMWQWNGDDCEEGCEGSEFTIFGETKFDSVEGTVFNPAYIKSMANIDGGLSYLTATGGLFINYPGSVVNSSFHGVAIGDPLITIEGRDVMLPIQDYIILFGPNSVGIAYKVNKNNATGEIRWEFQKVLNDIGYFSRDAVLNFREQAYFVDQESKFWRVNIKPYDTGTSVRFQLDLDDMSMHRVNTDFRMMNRKQGDQISLHKNGFEILVFMTDNRHNSSPRNTKILIFDEEHKFWHRWMVCGIDIRHYANGCWYGDEMFCNQGDTDNGNPIKQIISMNFGETSMFTMKEMAFLKTALGYHSRITNDTILKISVDTGGYKATKKIKHLHRTKYLGWLNKLWKSGMTDESMLERFFHGLPTGIGVYSGNGVGLVEEVKHELTKEFEQYCGYENLVTETVPCPCKSNPEITEHSDGCTINPDKTQNFEDDTEQQYFTPSKYAVIKSNLGYQCHNMHIEIIANNKDEIEFLGWFIGWMFMDNSMEYLENCTDYPTTPEISKLPGKYLPK